MAFDTNNYKNLKLKMVSLYLLFFSSNKPCFEKKHKQIIIIIKLPQQEWCKKILHNFSTDVDCFKTEKLCHFEEEKK